MRKLSSCFATVTQIVKFERQRKLTRFDSETCDHSSQLQGNYK